MCHCSTQRTRISRVVVLSCDPWTVPNDASGRRGSGGTAGECLSHVDSRMCLGLLEEGVGKIWRQPLQVNKRAAMFRDGLFTHPRCSRHLRLGGRWDQATGWVNAAPYLNGHPGWCWARTRQSQAG